MVRLLAALLMVVSLALPGVASGGPSCHHHHLPGAQAAPVAMAHQHDHFLAASHDHHRSVKWQCEAQGVSCDSCAICCCGAVLPTVTAMMPNRIVVEAPIAIAPVLSDGVLADRDPYPPKRWRT